MTLNQQIHRRAVAIVAACRCWSDHSSWIYLNTAQWFKQKHEDKPEPSLWINCYNSDSVFTSLIPLLYSLFISSTCAYICVCVCVCCWTLKVAVRFKIWVWLRLEFGKVSRKLMHVKVISSIRTAHFSCLEFKSRISQNWTERLSESESSELTICNGKEGRGAPIFLQVMISKFYIVCSPPNSKSYYLNSASSTKWRTNNTAMS